MSLIAAIILIVIADMALIAGLAWVMSHPRKLTPHVPASADASGGQPRTAERRARRPLAPHAGTGSGRHVGSRRRQTAGSAS